jgi:hypothetical protein
VVLYLVGILLGILFLVGVVMAAVKTATQR